MLARTRLLIVLAFVPLSAFTCVPTPLMRVAVDDVRNNSSSGSPLSASAYEEASALAAVLVTRFQLVADESCAFGRYRPIAPDRCLSLSRLGNEGIHIEIAYEAKRELTTISLVKEMRAFGRYSTDEVHDAFRSQIVLRLVAKFGEERVRVQD